LLGSRIKKEKLFFEVFNVHCFILRFVPIFDLPLSGLPAQVFEMTLKLRIYQ
jgi:hypothetical protein